MRILMLALVALAAWAVPAAAADRDRVAPAILADEPFPIGLWWPPPPGQTTESRYREIADAGFTFVHGGNGVTGVPRSRRMLEVAERAGLRGIVVDPRLTRLSRGEPTEKQARAEIAAVLADYTGLPALAGFNLFEEPNADRFGALSILVRELRRQAPDQLGDVNLWPSDVPSSDWASPPTRPTCAASRTRSTRR